MSSKPTWEHLIVEAQKGNSKMYNMLLQEVSQYLQSYLRYKLRDSDAVNDVLQDILISIHKSRHTYEAQYPFKPWLFKIVHSRMIDHFRRVKKFTTNTSLGGDEDLLALAAEAEISQIELTDFNRAVSFLSSDQRSVLQALKIDGKSVREISQEFAMTESSVKVIAHRAYKLLFEKLGVEK